MLSGLVVNRCASSSGVLRLALALVVCLFAATFSAAAQAGCSAAPDGGDSVHQAYAARNWAETVHLAQSHQPRSAEDNFDYGMALAHLQRWPEAHAALLAGEQQCPRDKRFPIELAGVAFQRKRYPEAESWLRRAIRLDPADQYANNFAATVYYLMGNLEAALHYWNRVEKPRIASLNIDPNLHVQRLLLEPAFTFSPAAILRQSQFETTESRIHGLGIFPAYNITLAARPDGSFDANFHGIERHGFGNTPLQALVSTFSGLPYETIYPSYYDLRHEAMNLESLLRWDTQKRRLWIALSAPLANLPQRRWQLETDDRDENWSIRRSSGGNAPVLGSLNLQIQTGTASLTSFTTGRFTWSMGAQVSHRSYRDVNQGSALTSKLLLPGTQLKFLGSADYKLLDIPERRFTLTGGAASETARLWSTPVHGFEKLQGSVLAHWFPQAQSDTWELQQGVRAGAIAGTPPFDELFMLGVERDNGLWLRGHIATRGGRKGSAPIGDRYFLSNNDFYRRIYSNGLLTIHAGPLLDIGRMGAPASGLSSPQWFFDTGVEAKLTVLGTNVVLTWGHDLRSGSNTFFGTALP